MVTRKIAAGIVRLRTGILLVMLALAVVCAGCIGKTHINYDLTRYLNSETMTRRALDVMQAEFGSSEQLRVMFRERGYAFVLRGPAERAAGNPAGVS